MSNTFVSGSAVNLSGFLTADGKVAGIVQNLGPGHLYLDRYSGVTQTSGVRVSPGESVCASIPLDTDLYAINGNGDCYLRIMTGITSFSK